MALQEKGMPCRLNDNHGLLMLAAKPRKDQALTDAARLTEASVALRFLAEGLSNRRFWCLRGFPASWIHVLTSLV